MSSLTALDPSPEKKPKRRRRRTRALGVLFVLFLVGALGSGWLLVNNLKQLTLWAVHRALPAAIVEIGHVRFDGPSQLIVEKFILRERKSRQEVLRLDRGSIVFSFEKIWRGQIGEVRLIYPVITATPGIGNILPAGDKKKSGGPSISVARIVCDYGEVRYAGTGEHSPLVQLKLSLDWKDVGDPAAAEKPLDLTIWDAEAFAPGFSVPFLTLDVVRATASPAGLLARQSLDAVAIQGGRLVVGEALMKIFLGPPNATTTKPANVWRVGRLDIANVAVRLDDQRPEVADITFVLNTTFQDLPLSQTADAVGSLPQSVEIADLEVLSPHDPFVKVLTLRKVTVGFHLAGLLRKTLDEVVITQPTIYVGEDLFWYMEDTQKRFAGNGGGDSPGWTIGRLDIRAGTLVVGSSGRANYGLPLNFRATASDVELDNLASLKIETAFEIPAEDYDFESYQLAISTQGGDLRLSYPPEKGEKNLVGKVFINRVVWRQYESTDAWVSATFDAKGINGEFGGKAYGGYVNGGFSFFFDSNSPWIGWLAGERVSLRQLTDVISPQNFRMTGPLDFRLQMDAFGKNIERVKGDFHTRRAGKMTISKLDDFLARIPDTWSSLKSSSTRIALEALRDFDYDKANGSLWFVRGQGLLDLAVQGPLGSRKFEVVLHADESKEGQWKVGR